MTAAGTSPVRHVALFALGWMIVVLMPALWRIAPFEVLAPDVSLIFGVYLGVTARSGLAGPTAAAVGVGYMADLLGGSPPGLYAFVAGLACVGARLITLRLLVRGGGFVLVLVASLSLAASLLVLALKAFHGAHLGKVGDELVAMLGGALITGAVAVPLFKAFRAVDARFARTEREREGIREGLLN